MTETTHSTTKKYYLSFISNLLIPLGGLSTDIYLPSLPAMSGHFQASRSLIQLTITVYVVAMGLGQLVAGPVSDALGRRKLVIVSLIIQCLCIFGILLSNSVIIIILLRAIQGFAMAFMMVAARAMLNDVFTGIALKKQLTYITTSFAIGPIVAPFIGGYLQFYFDWQASFYFILIFIFIAFGLALFTLPETISRTHAFHPRQLIHNYSAIMKNSHFISISLFAGLMMAYTTLFSLLGPFIIQDVLHRTAITYGHFALLIGFAWFLGNLLNRLLFHVSENKKIGISLVLTSLIAIIMLALTLHAKVSIALLIIPTFFMVMLSGLIFGIAVAKGLSMFTTHAGSANACLFSIAWLIYGLITVVATFLKVSSLVPLATAYLLFNIICFSLYYFKMRKEHA